jgi:hypothetical protein
MDQRKISQRERLCAYLRLTSNTSVKSTQTHTLRRHTRGTFTHTAMKYITFLSLLSGIGLVKICLRKEHELSKHLLEMISSTDAHHHAADEDDGVGTDSGASSQHVATTTRWRVIPEFWWESMHAMKHRVLMGSGCTLLSVLGWTHWPAFLHGVEAAVGDLLFLIPEFVAGFPDFGLFPDFKTMFVESQIDVSDPFDSMLTAVSWGTSTGAARHEVNTNVNDQFADPNAHQMGRHQRDRCDRWTRSMSVQRRCTQ